LNVFIIVIKYLSEKVLFKQIFKLFLIEIFEYRFEIGRYNLLLKSIFNNYGKMKQYHNINYKVICLINIIQIELGQ